MPAETRITEPLADLPRSVLEEVVNRLRALRAAGQPITAAVEAHADALGVSERTLWRWIKHGLPQPRRAPRLLTEDEQIEFFRVNGSVARLWRALGGDDFGVSLRTMQRAVKATLTPAQRAHASGGVRESRKLTIYTSEKEKRRNDLLQIDSYEVPVYLDGDPGNRPWLVAAIESFSRAIWAYKFCSARPTQTDVLDVLHMAVIGNPDIGPAKGIPAAIRCDLGLEYLADSVRDFALVLGSEIKPTHPYAPHEKGKIERLFRTLDQESFGELANHSGGPRRADNRLYWCEADPHLTLAQLEERFRAWARYYNTERPHKGIAGQIPAARWTTDPTPLRTADPQFVAWMATASGKRTVTKKGVQHDNNHFVDEDAKLLRLVGETVEIRYRPGDDTHVNVWYQRKLFCVAVNADQLTADQLKNFRANRTRINKEAAEYRRLANKRAAAEMEPSDPQRRAPNGASDQHAPSAPSNGNAAAPPTNGAAPDARRSNGRGVTARPSAPALSLLTYSGAPAPDPTTPNLEGNDHD
jgi:putative transposase